MGDDQFIGTWRLLSVESRTDDGSVHHPYGRDAQGYITYTADGFMSVQIMVMGRPSFASADIRGGTQQEKAAAAEGFLSYAGRYTVKPDKVIHHIEVSLFPNWLGVDQERLYEFERDLLKLSTTPMLLRGKSQTAHLVWQISAAGQPRPLADFERARRPLLRRRLTSDDSGSNRRGCGT